MWEWSRSRPRDPARISIFGKIRRAQPSKISRRAKAGRAMTSDPEKTAIPPAFAPGKDLSPAARRALDEAALRRAEIDARAADVAKAKEHQGRGGLEPVRYEDWEVKGLASDF